MLKEAPVVESKKGAEMVEQSKRANAPGGLMVNPMPPGALPTGTTAAAMVAAAGAAATTAASAAVTAATTMNASTAASGVSTGGGGIGSSGIGGLSSTGGGLSSSSMPMPVIATPKGGDLTSLISVGLIGALNTNGGTSNTSALASTLFASGVATEESSFNKRLLSRFGCYLIVTVVKPDEIGTLVFN